MTVLEQPQWSTALAKGEDLRLRSVEVKRSIKCLPQREGLERVADLLENPDDAAGVLRVERLFSCVKRFGPSTVQCFFRSATGFDPYRQTRRVRDLTVRERAALILAVRKRLA